MDLTGKVAIVTGAARGIGLAIAARYHQAGASVVLADRDGAAVAAGAASLAGREDRPGRAEAVVVDVSDRASVDAMVEEALTVFGRVDIMVCNAGIWKNLTSGPFWKLELEEWRNTFRVNTDGAFNCASAVAPHLIAQRSGRIILIGSAAVGEALAHITQYCASKSALTGLMRCAARELGLDGITVNLIHPGQLDTGAFSREKMEERAQQKFIHRIGLPRDLEGIVTLLASEEGGFITAQQIYVDGGGVMN